MWMFQRKNFALKITHTQPQRKFCCLGREEGNFLVKNVLNLNRISREGASFTFLCGWSMDLFWNNTFRGKTTWSKLVWSKTTLANWFGDETSLGEKTWGQNDYGQHVLTYLSIVWYFYSLLAKQIVHKIWKILAFKLCFHSAVQVLGTRHL